MKYRPTSFDLFEEVLKCVAFLFVIVYWMQHL